MMSNQRRQAATAPKSKTSNQSNTSASTNSKASAQDRSNMPPMLTYATQGANNFYVFRKEGTVHFMAKPEIGHLASFMKTGEMYEPEEIVIPDASELTEQKDPLGLKKRKLFKDVDRREAIIAKMKEAWPSFSAQLWALCSAPSQAAIKAYVPPLIGPDNDPDGDFDESGDDDSDSEKPDPLTYVNFEKTNNPFLLWKLIEATHVSSLVGSAIPNAVSALKKYANLHQKPEQSTDSYMEAVEIALIAMKNTCLPSFPKSIQAGMYIAGLDDRRYATMKSELTNDESKGLTTRPTTLLEAHAMATKRTNVITRTSAADNDGPTSVFVANAAHGAGRPRNDRNKPRANAPVSGIKSDPKADAKADSVPPGECLLCHKTGHWMTKCPDLAAAADALARQNAPTKHGKVALCSPDDPDSVVFSAISAEIFAAPAPNGLRSTSALFDSGANAHLFFNAALLTNIRAAPFPINVTGIGGTIHVTQIGDFQDLGWVYYSTDLTVNVYAMASAVRSGRRVTLEDGNFRVHTPTRTVDFTCRPNGLYVCDFGRN